LPTRILGDPRQTKAATPDIYHCVPNQPSETDNPYLCTKTCVDAHGGHLLAAPLRALHHLKIISSNATFDQPAVTFCPLNLDTPMAPPRSPVGARDWQRGPTVIRMKWQARRRSCYSRVGRRRHTALRSSHQIMQVRTTARC